ncbi:MAG: hypothetical protein OEV78_09295 [Spirochaetia bacterium]|nr:hypothetical protein [Spirochaetia bacterium]
MDTVQEIEQGYHEHDGFYFRFLDNFGLGYTYQNLATDQNHKEISDWVENGSFQFGYAIEKNIILYGGFSSEIIPPYFTLSFLNWFYNGFTGASIQVPDYSALLLQYSAGITYYFMPQNIYISIALDLSQAGVGLHMPQVGINSNTTFSETNLGFGIQTAIGKEWWVSKNWGLGLALNINYDYFPTTRVGYPLITPMHAFAIGISFSATYN